MQKNKKIRSNKNNNNNNNNNNSNNNDIKDGQNDRLEKKETLIRRRTRSSLYAFESKSITRKIV